jgi:hypothetical protein
MPSPSRSAHYCLFLTRFQCNIGQSDQFAGSGQFEERQEFLLGICGTRNISGVVAGNKLQDGGLRVELFADGHLSPRRRRLLVFQQLERLIGQVVALPEVVALILVGQAFPEGIAGVAKGSLPLSAAELPLPATKRPPAPRAGSLPTPWRPAGVTAA